jgi:hypothetical protein
MKLKTILLIGESAGFGMAGGSLGGSLTSYDTQLRAKPGSMDDVESWDGIVEGDKWFCHIQANDWDKKLSGASVTITENDKHHKFWIKIKTHGLRKTGDTNESYRQRVKKHSNKIARKWISEAKKLHRPELNEVGNEIPKYWSESFKKSIESIKPFISDWGEKEIDSVNFTYRK